MQVKIKFDRHGNVKKVIGDVGRTRMNRAALELWKGNIEPSFGYKLRRFIRRAVNTLDAMLDEAERIAFTPEPQADEITFIGLEEHVS